MTCSEEWWRSFHPWRSGWQESKAQGPWESLPRQGRGATPWCSWAVLQPQQPALPRALCLCWGLETFLWSAGGSMLIPGSTADSQGLEANSIQFLLVPQAGEGCAAPLLAHVFHLPAAVLAQLVLSAGYQSCACCREVIGRDAQHFPISCQDCVCPALPCLQHPLPTTEHSKKCWQSFSDSPSSALYSMPTLLMCVFLSLSLLHNLCLHRETFIAFLCYLASSDASCMAVVCKAAALAGSTSSLWCACLEHGRERTWIHRGAVLLVLDWKGPCALNYPWRWSFPGEAPTWCFSC